MGIIIFLQCSTTTTRASAVCQQYDTVSRTSVVVQTSILPQTVKVTISAPLKLSSCDDLILDMSQSIGAQAPCILLTIFKIHVKLVESAR